MNHMTLFNILFNILSTHACVLHVNCTLDTQLGLVTFICVRCLSSHRNNHVYKIYFHRHGCNIVHKA